MEKPLHCLVLSWAISKNKIDLAFVHVSEPINPQNERKKNVSEPRNPQNEKKMPGMISRQVLEIWLAT